jgi:hypothetical protein
MGRELNNLVDSAAKAAVLSPLRSDSRALQLVHLLEAQWPLAVTTNRNDRLQ